MVLSTAVSHGGRDRDGCEEKENLKITVPLKGGAGGPGRVTLGHHPHKFPSYSSKWMKAAGA